MILNVGSSLEKPKQISEHEKLNLQNSQWQKKPRINISSKTRFPKTTGHKWKISKFFVIENTFTNSSIFLLLRFLFSTDRSTHKCYFLKTSNKSFYRITSQWCFLIPQFAKMCLAMAYFSENTAWSGIITSPMGSHQALSLWWEQFIASKHSCLEMIHN